MYLNHFFILHLRTVTFDLPTNSRTERNNFGHQVKGIKVNVYKATKERLERIVGGKESPFHQHPWQVLRFDTGGDSLITGGHLDTVNRSG